MTDYKSSQPLFNKTYIESIDKQYESIGILTDELSIIIKGDCELEQVSQLFYKLIYINTHYFMQEQITLAKYNYIQLPQIKAIHKLFIDKVMDGREKLNIDTLAFCTQTLDFLNNWFVDYIDINNDAVKFLISKNVK